MRRTVIVLSFSWVALCAGSGAEERQWLDLEPLRSGSLGSTAPRPPTVTSSGDYALSLDGDLYLGGRVFKDSYPFLHNRGGTDHRNLALGLDALVSVTPGMPLSSSGTANTAIGQQALRSTTTARDNTAVGSAALYSNIGGSSNTAIGSSALRANTYASWNTAVGANALRYNDYGYFNTAVGLEALKDNTTASLNTATGAFALQRNTTGGSNTACGYAALKYNSEGDRNVAIGAFASYNGNDGSRNIAIGTAAGYFGFGSSNIWIANEGESESNTLRIGEGTGTQNSQLSRAFISGIRDAIVTGVQQDVCVDENDQLGPCSLSARRFKERIQDLGGLSSRLLHLRPVVFSYKPGPDEAPRRRHFGLIAEEVAEVYPELVVLDDAGQPLGVRYDLLAPLLLNELQKQHRHVRLQWAMLGSLALVGVVLAGRRRKR